MDNNYLNIAVPIFERRIAPRLDIAERILFANVEDRKIVNEEEVRIIGVHPLNMASWFKGEGINVVICCGIDSICKNSFDQCGIQLVSWIAGDAREAIKAYLNGTLDRMAIPTEKFSGDSCCRRFRCRGETKGRKD